MCIMEESFIDKEEIPINHDYCAIGNGIIIGNKIKLKCGHIFCKECFNKLLDNKCPLCRATIGDTISLDSSISDKLISVKCVYEGCQFKCKINGHNSRSYYDHDSICALKLVKCSNKKCEISLRKMDLAKHEKECKHRRIKCRYCGKMVPMLSSKHKTKRIDCNKCNMGFNSLCLYNKHYQKAHMYHCDICNHYVEKCKIFTSCIYHDIKHLLDDNKKMKDSIKELIENNKKLDAKLTSILEFITK